MITIKKSRLLNLQFFMNDIFIHGKNSDIFKNINLLRLVI